MSPGTRRALWPLAFAGLACGLFALAFAQFRPYLERPDLDHGVHLLFAQALAAGGPLLPHFGYHLMLVVASAGSIDLDVIRRCANVVLSLLVLAKLGLSLAFARSLLATAGARLRPAAACVLAFALFVAPLPNWWHTENVYLGQLTPTIWHNPTAIAALPLCVAAFWAFLLPYARAAREDRRSGLLTGLSVLVKPNFALAFLPAAGLLRLTRHEPRLRARLTGLAWIGLPALVALAWQYRQIVHAGLEPGGEGVLTLQPLAVWEGYSPHPLASALLSLAFPLAVAAASGRSARLGRALAAAWLLASVAIAQFALLAEPEPRLGDGNYYWGVVPAVYLLFLVSACELVARAGPGPADEGPPSRRSKATLLCWLLFGLHVASGVLFYLEPFQIAVLD